MVVGFTTSYAISTYHLNIKANSFEDVTVRVMVFKATFNNISVIL
jgi:hypothetical protein